MAFKEKEMQLKSANNATYKTVEGVTYFKLKSEFDGDYTKHCGLLGEEIDENFYFLRGYDIESIVMDENRNLIINRVDKDYAPIVIKVGEQLGNPSFEFEKETGTVTVTFPDGTTSKMDGFLVEGRDIRMATDSTFNGDGTIFNPLRLSPIEMTGTFAPANEYFDLTENGGKMPLGKGKGYRIVTREKIDNFGCLYPYSAVEKIQNKLKELKSQWRVATKEDWDELLNAVECKPNRNHDSKVCKWLGKDAGVALKSTKLWDEVTHKYGDKIDGQDILGLSVYPLGITPDRNEILNEADNDAEGFGKLAGMWTSTLNEEGNAYVKVFGFNEGRVDQDTYGKGARLSIRLVKDYNYSNYNEIETILGYPYPTELVYGTEKDNPYVKIWTKINFYSDVKILNGIRSKEWDVVSDSDKGVKILYFINEWNGTEWLKKPMDEGDSVVILNYIAPAIDRYYQKFYNVKIKAYEYRELDKEAAQNAINAGFKFEKLNAVPSAIATSPDYVHIHIDSEKAPYHEWRIINEELIDTAGAIKEEFREELDVVHNNIFVLSGHTIDLTNEFNNFSAWTVETINEFSAATEEHIKRLDTERETVSAITTENIERIDATITKVSAITTSNIERIDKDVAFVSAFTTENIERIDKDVAFVSEAVVTVSAITTEFSAATVAEIARLDKRVDDETQARIDNDITPGQYELPEDHSSGMTIPTNSDKVDDVVITIPKGFFDFGEF